MDSIKKYLDGFMHEFGFGNTMEFLESTFGS